MLNFAQSQFKVSRVIHTTNGALRGRIRSVETFNGHFAQVEQFLGVPYAVPPMDNLRFMPPARPHSWRGIRTMNDKKCVCLQNTAILDAITNLTLFYPYLDNLRNVLVNQSEDCLYLNIYLPARGKLILNNKFCKIYVKSQSKY